MSMKNKKRTSMKGNNRIFKILMVVCLAVLGISGYFMFLYHPFKADLHYVAVQNGRIGYYLRGKGEPLLLIEGFGMSMEDWDPALIRELAKQHLVIVYDLRGVGSSKADVASLSVTQMADDTVTLLNVLHLPRTSILGWSMGSLIAQELAINHPERVEKLILASTFTGDKNTISAQQSVNDYFQQNLPGAFVDRYVPAMFPMDTKGRMALNEYLERRRKALLTGESPTTPNEDTEVKVQQEAAMGQLQETDRTLELTEIRKQSLVLVGDQDVVIPISNDKKVVALIPGATLRIVTGAGHAVLFTNSETVNRDIVQFLRGK
jgi:pimeloyl-ACP methyl ester carboxylesterase